MPQLILLQWHCLPTLASPFFIPLLILADSSTHSIAVAQSSIIDITILHFIFNSSRCLKSFHRNSTIFHLCIISISILHPIFNTSRCLNSFYSSSTVFYHCIIGISILHPIFNASRCLNSFYCSGTVFQHWHLHSSSHY